MRRTLGNYIVGDLLGTGGMGEVFAGSHRHLGDPVAIKLVRDTGFAGAGADRALEALIAEARKMRAVDHRNVVRVLDVGRDDDTGACYLVMERVDGDSLERRLQREGRLADDEVRRLGAAIADGVQAAHSAGIVHCDLKPGNIVLDGDQPRLVDFGIARQVSAGGGRRLGTPAYMAPEQIEAGVVAPAVDIWALGVILYRALTGELPFAAGGDDRAAPQLVEVAPPLVDVAPDLETLVRRCLDRDPARRPASMAEVASALRAAGDDRYTQDLGPPPQPVAPGPVAAPSAAARRRLPVAIAVVAVAATAVVIALLARGGDDAAAGGQPAVEPAAVADGGVTAAGSSSDAAALRAADAGPATIELEVRSRPRGAEILVDGAFRGVTPARLPVRLPATIAVRKRGYHGAERRVDRAGPVELTLRKRRRRPPTRPPAAEETLD